MINSDELKLAIQELEVILKKDPIKDYWIDILYSKDDNHEFVNEYEGFYTFRAKTSEYALTDPLKLECVNVMYVFKDELVSNIIKERKSHKSSSEKEAFWDDVKINLIEFGRMFNREADYAETITLGLEGGGSAYNSNSLFMQEYDTMPELKNFKDEAERVLKKYFSKVELDE